MLASLALSLLVMLSAPSSPTENGRPRPGPKATVPTQTIEKARQRLDNDLGDYPSARFRNVIAQGEADRAKFCGEINSRNRMGGMTTGSHRYDRFQPSWLSAHGHVRWTTRASRLDAGAGGP